MVCSVFRRACTGCPFRLLQPATDFSSLDGVLAEAHPFGKKGAASIESFIFLRQNIVSLQTSIVRRRRESVCRVSKVAGRGLARSEERRVGKEWSRRG